MTGVVAISVAAVELNGNGQRESRWPFSILAVTVMAAGLALAAQGLAGASAAATLINSTSKISSSFGPMP